MILTEHWKTKEQLKNHKFQNYKLITSFCRDVNQHGGVALYCEKSLRVKNRSDINKLSESKVFECVGAEFKIGTLRVIVVAVYRNPDYKVDVFLFKMYELLNILHEVNVNFVVGGDFNIDFLNQNDVEVKSLISLLESFDTEPAIKEYTRVHYNGKKSCLDNFFTSFRQCSSRAFDTHISDHRTTELVINFLLPENNYFKNIRCINDDSIQQFGNSLMKEDWQELLNIPNNEVNEQWKLFSSSIFFCLIGHFQSRGLKLVSMKTKM